MGNHLDQIKVSFEYLRHLGPRFAHGVVRLQFDSMRKHSFRSEAVWPEGADYTQRPYANRSNLFLSPALVHLGRAR
jgi:hypothetical protein